MIVDDALLPNRGIDLLLYAHERGGGREEEVEREEEEDALSGRAPTLF